MWLSLGVYAAGLCTVLGVLAERRWGWMPVKARGVGAVVDDTPVPRGIQPLSLGGMSSRWSEKALARGWSAGGMQAGFFPAPGGPEPEHGAPWVPSPAWHEPVDTLGPGLGDLKVMNLELPNFGDLTGK